MRQHPNPPIRHNKEFTMSFLSNGSSDPMPECFLATADTLVQAVMQKYRSNRREAVLEVNLEESVEFVAAVA
jgi:hypothetical protein